MFSFWIYEKDAHHYIESDPSIAREGRIYGNGIIHLTKTPLRGLGIVTLFLDSRAGRTYVLT